MWWAKNNYAKTHIFAINFITISLEWNFVFTHHLKLHRTTTHLTSRPPINASWPQHLGKIHILIQGQPSRVLILSWASIGDDSTSVWCNIAHRWPHLHQLLRASIYTSHYMPSLLQAWWRTEDRSTENILTKHWTYLCLKIMYIKRTYDNNKSVN